MATSEAVLASAFEASLGSLDNRLDDAHGRFDLVVRPVPRSSATPSIPGVEAFRADVPPAVKILYDEGRIRKVLVVDLDAHQGNGTAAVFQNWDWASSYDLYERDIFPARKEPEDFPLPVDPALTGPSTWGS